ncbi:MAG: ATP-grasp domain-containing protein, partial [Campylobacterales bacterium]|nr:ATP-grasp domain-containing protein [Campylobacterales bacterium]
MNILFSTVGRRGYIINYFKQHLDVSRDKIIGTSDRNDCKSEFTSGFFYCDKTFLVPSITEEEKYVKELLNICKKENINMLLSFYDLDSYILSKYIEDFKKVGVVPVVSSFRVNDIAFDKLKTYEFLLENGLNSPKTWSSEKAINNNEITFPVIVKPRYGFGSNFIHIARNREQMLFFLNYNVDDELIVQEFLHGQEYSFDILNDLNAVTVVAVAKKKIKMRSGETDQGYAIEEPRLIEIAYKLGSALGHIGPLDVDFFVVEQKVYILELNPRFGGGYPITTLLMSVELRTKNFKRNELLEQFLSEVNDDLWSVEEKLIINKEPKFPIIFIVGALRSGSTLMTQWLANLGFAYPTNLMSRFYKAPIVASKIQMLLTDERYNYRNEIRDFSSSINFSSENGKTKGALAPNEFWYFWRRFLPFKELDYLPSQELFEKVDVDTLKSEFAGMIDVFQKPFALKGMILNYNIDFLDKVFEKAIFIYTKRDPLTNIESALKAREKQLGSIDEWYSFKIPEYEELKKLNPYEQVAGQIY